MSWLRIDDGFTANKKVAQLSDGEFRCWMRLLCHCAHAGDPMVTVATVREVATLTKARVKRFAEIGLVDVVAGGHEVHDWILYSDSTVGAKVDYYLREHPEASGNEVVRAIGSKRELVLAEVKRLRGSESGSAGTVHPGSESGSPGTTKPGSESGSRTRAPDPTPPEPIEETQAVRALEDVRRPRHATHSPGLALDQSLVREMP